MALVNYPSSSEDDDAEKPLSPGLKRKQPDEDSRPGELPPLPAKFFDLYASTARLSTRDDPSLHGGRQRVTPHVEGNWPTHLYIEWCPSAVEYTLLTRLITTLQQETPSATDMIQSLLNSDLGAPLPLHISLSRSISLTTEEKDPFGAALVHAIGSSGVRPFQLQPCGIDWVPNFQKTRWFLVLRLAKPHDNGLNKLLCVSNDVAQAFHHPALYTAQFDPISPKRKRLRKSSGSSFTPPSSPPSSFKLNGSRLDKDLTSAFHISIGWKLEPPSPDLVDRVKRRNAEGEKGWMEQICVPVGDIKAKLGNAVTSISLLRNVAESRGSYEL